MILNKQMQLLPEDPMPTEAPPSYEELNVVVPTTSPTANPTQRPGSSYPQEKPTTYPPPTPPQAPYAFTTNSRISSLPSLKSPVYPSPKSKRTNSWFAFGQASKTTRDVRATVVDLLRDVVKQQQAGGAGSAAMSIIDSCADACRAYALSISSIIQDRTIEGHSALYWAIVNRPPGPPPPSPAPEPHDFLSSLIAHAAPLSDASVSEMRLACLQNSDQALFQRLRRSPAFAPANGTDEMLLGENVRPDEVRVENVLGDEGAFVVRVECPIFQRRMRVSQEVCLEFIARGSCSSALNITKEMQC